MNSINTFFVLSVIFVPTMLIILNYPAIQESYKYGIPCDYPEIIQYSFKHNFEGL